MTESLDFLKDVLLNSIMITGFVVVIMLFIELLHVLTSGKWSNWLSKSSLLQVSVAAILGLIPGCFGGFASVGMWTHGVIGFGALVAAMIASVGDEAFVMLVQMPNTALLLFGILFVIAVGIGCLIDRLKIKVSIPVKMEKHLVLHDHEMPASGGLFQHWKINLKNLSFSRVLLLTGLGLFIVGMFLGVFEHEHSEKQAYESPFSSIFSETWFNGIFIILASILFVVFIFVNDHFLEDHFWKHVLKQHVPKIFLWTFGALIMIHFIVHSVEAANWLNDNRLWVLLFAVLIGFIPESGPHLVFVTLFLSGQIPFSILLANSITQDGHSTLPLLAESKKGFLAVKLINACVGMIFGLSGYFLGF
jgi:hypothetical protein